jgi:SAM-dependent methyltransferase
MALQWSQAMQNLYFRHVVLPIMEDKRTDWDANVSLGCPFDVIRDKVIKKGLADFTVAYDDPKYCSLSADDKVLLYCFINMKVHFFEALETFRYFRPALKTMFELPGTNMMVDLGCGPGTAALALGDSTKTLKLAYVGVDHARPMLRKAKELLEAAKGYGLLADSSVFAFLAACSRVSEIAGKLPKRTNVLINATYLFASHSLDVDEVCDVVLAFKNSAKVGRLLFTYTNTEGDLAGKKFQAFKKKLNGEFTSQGETTATIEFHKKRGSPATSTAKYVRQLILVYRPASS